MATVLFRSRPPMRCSFTLQLEPFAVDMVLGRTEGEAAVRSYGAEVEFADPLDTLIGFRAFCDGAEWQRTKLRGWWVSSLASRSAVELLCDDSELARSACAWLAGWTTRRWRSDGMLRFASQIVTDDGIAPRALADDEPPPPGLVLCRADGARRELVHVTRGGFVVGRHEGDLVIPEMAVARQHARFEVGSTGWTVEDLASPSGVWVNELRGGGRVALATGCVVRLGQVQLVVLSAQPG